MARQYKPVKMLQIPTLTRNYMPRHSMHTESYSHSTRNRILNCSKAFNSSSDIAKMKHSKSIDQIRDKGNSKNLSINQTNQADETKKSNLKATIQNLQLNNLNSKDIKYDQNILTSNHSRNFVTLNNNIGRRHNLLTSKHSRNQSFVNLASEKLSKWMNVRKLVGRFVTTK